MRLVRTPPHIHSMIYNLLRLKSLIKSVNLVIERDPNAETLHYLQCMKLKTRVYDVEQVYDPALIKISPDLKQILCLDAVIEDETLENDDEEEDSIEALINEISDEKRFYLVLKKAIKMAKIQSFTLDFVLQMPAVELGAQKFLSEVI